MKIKVGVIFGGESVEHEVSIISAIQAIEKMDNEKYEIIPIYITKDRVWYTGSMLKEIEIYQDMSLINRYAKKVVLYEKSGRFILQNKGFFKYTVNEIDLAFPIVHGTNVEDGVLQGYLQSIGIPFVGSDVYASVVGQDKVYMKQIFNSEELNVPNYIWFYDNEFKNDKEVILNKVNKLTYPLIVKPATLGSSVGIGVAKDETEVIEKIEEAIKYDKKILVEEVVNNLKEVNISVLGNYENMSLSEIEEVMTKNNLLTFEDKYIGGSKGKLKTPTRSKGMATASRIIPANINNVVKEKVEDMALRAFRALGNSGVCRIDFLINSKTNEVYINEINNIPGSLAFYLWEPKGKKYTELLDEMINVGIKDYKKRINKIHSFDSNILKNFGGTKGLKGLKRKI
ncbi:MAG: D-alanine--D-alanine ligase family protein [Bacilli bacterium]